MNINIFGLMIQADIPIYVVSEPGDGKTEFSRAVGRALGFKSYRELNLNPKNKDEQVRQLFHTEILSAADPTDIGGVLREDEDKRYVARRPLKWLYDACMVPTLVFLDELPLAPRANLAPALRMINEREAGDNILHPGTRFLAAGNPEEFTGVGLTPQLANRFAHVEFDRLVSLVQWRQGLVTGFPTPELPRLPDTWRSLIPKHEALIGLYAGTAPTEMFRKPGDGKSIDRLGGAWPSRRTWTMSARASAACEAGGQDDATAIGSLVGDGPALPYVGWRESQDLLTADEFFKNPERAKLKRG